MRRLVLIAFAAVAVPTVSSAQLQLGARLGYAIAGGDAAKDKKMSEGVKSQVPIQLDAAWRFTKELAVGAYFSYGFAQLASKACPSGADCSASDIRLGVQGVFTFADLDSFVIPWIGVGTGWERGHDEVSAGGQTAKLTYTGWEYLNLQVGGDIKASPQFSFGPYFLFAVGQFDKYKVESPLVNTDGSIPDKASHQWFHFGVRGKFDL